MPQGADSSPRTSSLPRWIGFALAAAALAVLPWTVWIFSALPDRQVVAHWWLAWGGFDVALACALAATGLSVLRRSQMTGAIAAVTGTLLLCDAWFDVVTARGSTQFMTAHGLALLVELPSAFVCFWVARNAELAGRELRPDVSRWSLRRMFMRAPAQDQ